MFSKENGLAASLIAAVWIGLILGVSFIAAPIKFTAVGISHEQLLAVGKVTFQAFFWVEIAAFVLLVCATLKNLNRKVLTGILLIGLLMLVQKFGVLPGLDNELDQAVAGEAADDTNLHFFYVALECIKLTVLLFLSLSFRKT